MRKSSLILENNLVQDEKSFSGRGLFHLWSFYYEMIKFSEVISKESFVLHCGVLSFLYVK